MLCTCHLPLVFANAKYEEIETESETDAGHVKHLISNIKHLSLSQFCVIYGHT